MLERDVMAYLKKRVEAAGGEVRKLRWIGRSHAPDVLVLLPREHFFVEGKKPGGKARPGQLREHNRLWASGVQIFVLDSKESIDELLK
jgi:hypothetical protein